MVPNLCRTQRHRRYCVDEKPTYSISCTRESIGRATSAAVGCRTCRSTGRAVHVRCAQSPTAAVEATAAVAAEATAATAIPKTDARAGGRVWMTPRDRRRWPGLGGRLVQRRRCSTVFTGRAPHQWRAAGADGCRRLPTRRGVAHGRTERYTRPLPPQCPACRQFP